MQLVVQSGGVVRCVYSEEIPLTSLGPLMIRRGSHVEPTDNGHWFADLAPVGGPRLGPFGQRSAALAAEVAWLEENWLTFTQPI
jgi:hypothetical protein